MTTAPSKDWPSYYAKLNPELEALLPALGSAKWLTATTTVQDLRAAARAKKPSELWPEVSEKDIQIPTRDGFLNRARIYAPHEDTAGGKPLLVMQHGGGFCVGNLEAEEDSCRYWVKALGGVAVSLEHRQAPEYQFPVPINDVYDSVKWVAANCQTFGADPTKGFVIGGISSGAAAMITVSHLWRDEKHTPPLTGVYASVPPPCIPSALPEKYKSRVVSWEQCKDAPLFNVETSKWLERHFNPDPFSPIRSPLLFPTGHKDLPPTYFSIAGADPWRDIGLLYEEILREECGIKTKVDVHPGLPHGFWTMFPNAEFSKEYWAKSDAGLKWLLEQSK